MLRAFRPQATTLDVADEREQRENIEHQTDPVAVGPTLVGYIVRHLEASRGGSSVPVRLAVLDRLETIGFELDALPAKLGQTQIRMKPSCLLVRLLIDPVVERMRRDDLGDVRRPDASVPRVRKRRTQDRNAGGLIEGRGERVSAPRAALVQSCGS